MKEYIEREAAINAAIYTSPLMPSQWLPIQHAIEAIPAADVRPVVSGKWIPYSIKDCLYYCSNCNALPATKTNYCPNCGAKMRDGE